MKKKYKFHLEKYHGMSSRHTCPKCNDKRSFVYYVDDKGDPVDETVGRCNHESSCKYHYTPQQYFQDNCIEPKDRPEFEKIACTRTVSYNEALKPTFIDANVVVKNLSKNSTFVDFLKRLLKDDDLVDHLCKAYQLGATHMREVIFWQIDNNLHIRTGKIMAYDLVTGHRIKNDKFAINWVHAKWKGKVGVPKEFNLKQCLFGEHLLRLFPLKPVAVVESEKTAIICYALFPDFVWVATGGKSNTDVMKMRVLKGRHVILFPDVDGYEKWCEQAKNYKFCDAIVSDILEKNASDKDRENKIDIADVLIEHYLKQ